MITLSKPEIEKLALEIAARVTGPDSVEKVAAESGVTYFDEPAYHITFLYHPDRALFRPGMAMARLGLALRDELDARGDEHLTVLRLLDETDWDGTASRYRV